jgi:hypothetical protein
MNLSAAYPCGPMRRTGDEFRLPVTGKDPTDNPLDGRSFWRESCVPLTTADSRQMGKKTAEMNALSVRLLDHADSIANPAAHKMEIDIRLAARVCSNLPSLRFRVAEIAEQALTQARAAIRRDQLDAWLTRSSSRGPGLGRG